MTKIEVQQIVYEMLKNMLSGPKGDKGDKGDPGVCKCKGFQEGYYEGYDEGYNKGWLAAFDEVTDDYWYDMLWHDEPEDDLTYIFEPFDDGDFTIINEGKDYIIIIDNREND